MVKKPTDFWRLLCPSLCNSFVTISAHLILNPQVHTKPWPLPTPGCQALPCSSTCARAVPSTWKEGDVRPVSTSYKPVLSVNIQHITGALKPLWLHSAPRQKTLSVHLVQYAPPQWCFVYSALKVWSQIWSLFFPFPSPPQIRTPRRHNFSLPSQAPV